MKKYFILSWFFLATTFLFPQWQQVNAGLPTWETQGWGIHSTNSSTAVISALCDTGSLFKTTNGGVSWFPLGLNQGVLLSDFSILSTNFIIGCNLKPAKILGTSNGGTDWYTMYDATSQSSFFMYLEMFDTNNGVAMGDANDDTSRTLFLRTNDGGQSWIPIENELLGGISGDGFRRIDFINPEVGYFYDTYTHKLFKTTNGAKNWKELSIPISTPTVLKFFNESFGFVFGHFNKMLRTTDGGLSWETITITDAGYGEDIEFLPGDSTKIWFLATKKLYFSSDAGLTWQMDPLSDSFSWGKDLEIVDGTGWLLCEKVYRNSNPNQITSINNELSIELNSFSLYQNYPNPFNPSTKISWQSPVSSWQTLKVYDVLGNEITTLVNEEKPAGTYEVDFNASSLPSGVYFYQLVTDGQSVSRKMILLR